MNTKYKIFKNFYRDSVTLMQLSARITALDGIHLASALMGTPANIQMMMDAGLLDSPPSEAAPNDLVFVVKGDDSLLDEAIAQFDKIINEAADTKKGSQEEKPAKSIAEALMNSPDATLALISVPGEYAGAEAMKALRRGLNVMIFSDNVSEEQEIELKQYATEHGLIVMGPDCGTAIIDGAPLAFANVVAKGKIGVVGASGTGTQEVTSIIDQCGEGITHAIGTGGHDLSANVGGLTMIAGLNMLISDSNTDVIVLVSKPPAKEVSDKILSIASSTKKPVVICFLGAPEESIKGANLTVAGTLEAAAEKAVQLMRKQSPDFVSDTINSASVQSKANSLKNTLKAEQKYIRGLYSGGTFCYEALLNLQNVLPEISSNIPTGKVKKLANPYQSLGNTIIDLGDDIFTRGKPHPMIDPSQRNERLLQEAADPETAVILLDVVIGYGANPDPAGELVTAVNKAKEIAAQNGREIVFVSFVCGTDNDPQGLNSQRKKLEDAGIYVCRSNAQAIAVAGAVMAKA